MKFVLGLITGHILSNNRFRVARRSVLWLVQTLHAGDRRFLPVMTFSLGECGTVPFNIKWNTWCTGVRARLHECPGVGVLALDRVAGGRTSSRRVITEV